MAQKCRKSRISGSILKDYTKEKINRASNIFSLEKILLALFIHSTFYQFRYFNFNNNQLSPNSKAGNN